MESIGKSLEVFADCAIFGVSYQHPYEGIPQKAKAYRRFFYDDHDGQRYICKQTEELRG